MILTKLKIYTIMHKMCFSWSKYMGLKHSIFGMVFALLLDTVLVLAIYDLFCIFLFSCVIMLFSLGSYNLWCSSLSFFAICLYTCLRAYIGHMHIVYMECILTLIGEYVMSGLTDVWYSQRHAFILFTTN